MLKVYATGFYGQKNFGDDLFCLVIMNNIKRNHKLKLVGVTQDIFEEYSHLSINSNKNIVNNKGLTGKFYRIFLNITAVFLSDVIIFGGGSVFGQYASYKQRNLTIFLAKLLNKKVYALGISVGPFKDNSQKNDFLKLLKKIDKIWIRDKKSEAYLIEQKVPYIQAGDIVFSLRNELGTKSTEKKLLVVAIHDEKYIKDSICSINKHIQNKGKVIVLSLDEESVAISMLMKELYSDSENVSFMFYNNNLIEVINVFKKAEFVITSKLHGAIISYILNIPFYLYTYQEKCTEFLKLIKAYDSQEEFKLKYLDSEEINFYDNVEIIENKNELKSFFQGL